MPSSDAKPNATSPLTAGEKTVLARIFQHPLSHNLSWRETLALIRTGGKVEHANNGDIVLTLGTEHQTFKPVHDKDLATEEVMALRHFLVRAGWAPSEAPTSAPAAVTSDTVIVIDRAEARVYPISSDDGATPHESHHLLHQIDRAQHDADREESYPADTLYFDAIAAAVAGNGRIVVVGHGKGQSDEADHLMAYLSKQHSSVHARVARTIVADLPHLTVSQLVQLARHGL